jgi:hypothetical protein
MRYEFNRANRRFCDIGFVLKAAAKKAERYQLQYVICLNNTLTGADGRRVHSTFGIPVPNGAYEVLQSNKQKIILYKIGELEPVGDSYHIISENKTIGLYPDCRKWEPSHKTFFEAETVINALYGLNQKHIGINIAYLSDIIDDFMCKWVIYYGLIGQPIKFVQKNRQAFLMPVELKPIAYKESE